MQGKTRIKRTKYFVITDEVGLDHTGWLNLLKPICKTIEKRISFPIDVIFKRGMVDCCYINKRIEIYIAGDETQDIITWTMVHEFRHYMQEADPLLHSCIYNGDRVFLTRLFRKRGKDWANQYHDVLPEEQDANIFASDLTGVYIKFNHSLDKRRKRLPRTVIIYRRPPDPVVQTEP